METKKALVLFFSLIVVILLGIFFVNNGTNKSAENTQSLNYINDSSNLKGSLHAVPDQSVRAPQNQKLATQQTPNDSSLNETTSLSQSNQTLSYNIPQPSFTPSPTETPTPTPSPINTPLPLTVSCNIVHPGSIVTGDPVTLVANVSGGNSVYSYKWSGENIQDNTQNYISVTYDSPGNKQATVTVTSGDEVKSCTQNIPVSPLPTITPTPSSSK